MLLGKIGSSELCISSSLQTGPVPMPPCYGQRFCPHRTSIFRCAGLVIVRGNQKKSPPGNQAPFVKASRCGNERQERSDRSKAGR